MKRSYVRELSLIVGISFLACRAVRADDSWLNKKVVGKTGAITHKAPDRVESRRDPSDKHHVPCFDLYTVRKIEGNTAHIEAQNGMILGVVDLDDLVLLDTAVSSIDDTFRKNPNLSPTEKASLLITRGTAHAAKKELDLALADAEEAINTNSPLIYFAYQLRAEALFLSGDFAAVVENFNDMLRLPANVIFPEDRFHAQLAIAQAYLEADDSKRAFEHIDLALNRAYSPNPEQKAHAYELRAAVYIKGGKMDDAVACFREAAKLDPKENFYRSQLFGLLLQEKPAEAQAVVEDALKVKPEDPEIMHMVAFFLASDPKSGELEGKRALQLALKACEKDGYQNAAYLQALAISYGRIGDFEKATEWQKKAYIGFKNQHERNHGNYILQMLSDKKPFSRP